MARARARPGSPRPKRRRARPRARYSRARPQAEGLAPSLRGEDGAALVLALLLGGRVDPSLALAAVLAAAAVVLARAAAGALAAVDPGALDFRLRALLAFVPGPRARGEHGGDRGGDRRPLPCFLQHVSSLSVKLLEPPPHN